jgi:hypothetical protein
MRSFGHADITAAGGRRHIQHRTSRSHQCDEHEGDRCPGTIRRDVVAAGAGPGCPQLAKLTPAAGKQDSLWVLDEAAWARRSYPTCGRVQVAPR